MVTSVFLYLSRIWPETIVSSWGMTVSIWKCSQVLAPTVRSLHFPLYGPFGAFTAISDGSPTCLLSLNRHTRNSDFYLFLHWLLPKQYFNSMPCWTSFVVRVFLWAVKSLNYDKGQVISDQIIFFVSHIPIWIFLLCSLHLILSKGTCLWPSQSPQTDLHFIDPFLNSLWQEDGKLPNSSSL